MSLQINLGEKYGIVEFDAGRIPPRERIAKEKKSKAGEFTMEDEIRDLVKTTYKGDGEPAFTEDQILDDGHLFDLLEDKITEAQALDFQERKKKYGMIQQG